MLTPRVDVPVPAPNAPSEDQIFDRFASLVLEHTRVVAVLIIVIALALMWKRPLMRGVLIGVLVLAGVLFVVNN